jgi:predicted TIM-barrel fold metal-dependent hydrolase
MRVYEVISADDHIVEPPVVFERLPKHLKGVAPQFVHTPKGDGWIPAPGAQPFLIGLGARTVLVTGGARESKSLDQSVEDVKDVPVTMENMAAGAYDPATRIADLDIDGVDAQVLYSQFMRHCLHRLANAEVRAAVARSYNEWIHTFDEYAPDRFRGLAVLPQLDDGDEVIQILSEASKLGLQGAWLTMTDGGKPLHHPDFERFWATAAELEMPISVHIDGQLNPFNRAMPPDYRGLPGTMLTNMCLSGVALGEVMGHLLFSGMFDKWPGLRVVLAEAGAGWIPYVIDRMDDLWPRFRPMGVAKNSRFPSEIAREQVFATIERDHSAVLTRHMWGLNNVMWASDYPHLNASWPHSRAVIKELFGELPEAESHKLVCGNVAKLYGFA